MNVLILPDNTAWHAQVELTDPLSIIDDSSMRKWMMDNCDHITYFSEWGYILFSHESDLIKFVLTWS